VIFDFIKMLFKSRIQGVKALGNAKVYGAQAKVKGKVANKFNQAVDAPFKKVKEKAAGKKDAPKQAKQDKADKEKGMGFFSKKQSAPPPQPDYDSGEDQRTMALSLDSLGAAQGREVVGWLVIMNGEQKGKDFRLFPGRNVIGTAADCEVVLTDAYLSSKHCAIRYEDEQYSLVDLDSTNGSYVNGKRTSKAELIDNDMIRLGKTELKFKALY